MFRFLRDWWQRRKDKKVPARIGKRLFWGAWQTVEVWFEDENLPYEVTVLVNTPDEKIVEQARELRAWRRRFPGLA